MNITLNGIKITQDSKNLAFEKNNNVDEIVITVDTDESWSYKLDVKYPDKFNIGKDALYNIIDLGRNGNICSVTLTREMLPFNGKYTMQLRGINGDKVYHSDTFEVWVKYSIEPGSTYNPVPSEFYQVEARLDNKVDEAKQYAENAEIASTRMPKISSDNTWLIWDAETGDYVDTGIMASGGTTDHSKLINRSAADQHPMSAITGLEKALESKQPAGAYLTDKDLDTTLKETGKAADAAEVGKRLSSLSEEIADLQKGGLLTVETITVDDDGETETIPVTGIMLDYTSIELNVGESMQLAASITPPNATNTAVTWESSSDSIATVVNGYVTAVSAGSAVITAKSVENPSITETCAVAVAEETGGGGDTPTGGKVQLSTHNIVDGSCVSKKGEVKTINNNAHYVEIPYTENMQISTAISTSWVNTYPPFIVKSGDAYSVPSYTIGEANLDTQPGSGTTYATQYLTTLTGYAAEATVIVNMTYADIAANDVYYYVVGGGE